MTGEGEGGDGRRRRGEEGKGVDGLSPYYFVRRIGIAGGGWGSTPVDVYRRSFLSFLNFNPWAKYQTFRHLTPSSFRLTPTLFVRHFAIL